MSTPTILINTGSCKELLNTDHKDFNTELTGFAMLECCKVLM